MGLFSSKSRLEKENERIKELEQKIEVLRDANIPVHYDPVKTHQKIVDRMAKQAENSKFKTRSVFMVTVLLVGFILAIVLIGRQEAIKNFTNIYDLPLYVDTTYTWLPTEDKNQFLLEVKMTLKQGIDLEIVRLNNNVVFDLNLTDADGKIIFNQKFAEGIKINITSNTPYILHTLPITEKEKNKIRGLELATETHLNKQKI